MNKQSSRRVPTRVHTRKLDRLVARTRMKNRGMVKVNKHFADNWKAYV